MPLSFCFAYFLGSQLSNLCGLQVSRLQLFVPQLFTNQLLLYQNPICELKTFNLWTWNVCQTLALVTLETELFSFPKQPLNNMAGGHEMFADNPLVCNVKPAKYLSIGNTVLHSGCAVIEILFANMRPINIGRISFVNNYTATLSIKMKVGLISTWIKHMTNIYGHINGKKFPLRSLKSQPPINLVTVG